MNKILIGLTISTVMFSSLNVSYGANDVDLNALINNLGTATNSTSTGTSTPATPTVTNTGTSIGGVTNTTSTGTATASTVVKPVTTTSPIAQDMKQDITVDSNIFKQTIKNNYLLKFKGDKDGVIEDIFSVKYTGDFGNDVTVSGKDIVKEFDVKVVRTGGTELSLAKGTLKEIKVGDELLITPVATSLAVNKQLTFTLAGNITPVEYGVVNAETSSYTKLGDYKKTDLGLPVTAEPTKTVETETPVKNATWPMENALVIITLLAGILFYTRKNKITV